ncbi:MAG: glycosyltransferase family 4 protein [Planctomycetia bacterium]|nr:glycosyltransferase family 4 protein [Planctomycetia bacterium]
MKIGFIYDAVYPWIKGGGEKTLYELASALRDRGHECHFFGMHLWDGPPEMVREGLHYHAICPAIPLYGPNGKRTISQPLKFAWGVLTKLGRYEPESFDLFDVQAFPFFSVPAFQLARRLRFRRVPWLLTWLEVWGSDYWRRYLGTKGILGAILERRCASTAPHHLCISPNTGRRLRELLGVEAEKISVIPRGFLPPDDATLAGFRTSRMPRQVVVAGRLLSYKQVDVVVRAWPEVRRRLPDATLHIVGDGPERAGLERLAVELGLTSNDHRDDGGVRFLGQLPEREQVLGEIAAAELLLQPSAREGQSTVVLEALTLGTPVLAAVGDETAVGDFLGSGPSAQLARLEVAASPAAWAERIVQLLTNDAARGELVAMGRREVAALGWQAYIAPAVERLYQEVIARATKVAGR